MCTRWLALLVFSLGISALLAQPTPPPPNQEQTMQILLDRIQQLEKRVSELEDHKRKQSAAQTGTSDSQTVAESTPVQANAAPAHALHSEHPANTTEIREMQVHYPSLQIRGFGDIDFSATDQKGSVSGFDLGQFVLHLASPLSEKVSYFGEVSFPAKPSGYDLQVERTIIRYDYNDYLKLSFGKYHTPIGYWNTAFHHGAWLQTTISRPEMVKFGGTFTPIPEETFLRTSSSSWGVRLMLRVMAISGLIQS